MLHAPGEGVGGGGGGVLNRKYVGVPRRNSQD